MCVADPNAGTANTRPVFCCSLNQYSSAKQPLKTSLQFFIQTEHIHKIPVDTKSFYLCLLHKYSPTVSFWREPSYGVWYFL